MRAMDARAAAGGPSEAAAQETIAVRRLRGRDCSRLLASEPDVKVSLHPAQAWNNAPGCACGPPLTGRGFDTVRPLA